MKHWASVIWTHVDTWVANLSQERNWWPKYVYHFTDVRNAVSALELGVLHSRESCNKQSLMQNDNASPSVISQTAAEHLKFVRMYFRPLTPTQYWMEGFRPPTDVSFDGAHCPMPIFFCFDSKATLARDDAQFSNGNMAKFGVQHGDGRNLFESIPFEYVFSHGGMGSDPAHKERLKFHRHAEVLIPNKLRLNGGLKMIACRSAAEMQTLIALLSAPARVQWQDRICVGHAGLFYRKSTYIRSVTIEASKLVFDFNPDNTCRGKHHLAITFSEDGVRTPRKTEAEIEPPRGLYNITLQKPKRGVFEMKLDGRTAWLSGVDFTNKPF